MHTTKSRSYEDISLKIGSVVWIHCHYTSAQEERKSVFQFARGFKVDSITVKGLGVDCVDLRGEQFFKILFAFIEEEVAPTAHDTITFEDINWEDDGGSGPVFPIPICISGGDDTFGWEFNNEDSFSNWPSTFRTADGLILIGLSWLDD